MDLDSPHEVLGVVDAEALSEDEWEPIRGGTRPADGREPRPPTQSAGRQETQQEDLVGPRQG